MASCLYDPADCESERTVIISELQGGENDPEQRLDTEITATAFKAHPYRHPTIGWIHDLRTMTREDLYGHYRRYYVPTTPPWSSSATSTPPTCCGGSRRPSARIPAGGRPRPAATEEPPQEGERRVHLRKPGTTAYLACRFPRPALHRSRLLPAAVRRRGVDRRVGPQHLVGRQGADSPAAGPALSRAGESRPGLVGRRLPGADRRAVPLLAERDGRRGAVAGGGRGGGARGMRAPGRPTGPRRRSSPRCRPSCARASSTTATA